MEDVELRRRANRVGQTGPVGDQIAVHEHGDVLSDGPHVVEHEGQYYLFRTSNYRDTPLTTVYRSADPTDFGIDNDSKIVATLPVAAPEVIRHDGQHWLAALNPQLDGIRLTKLEFVDP